MTRDEWDLLEVNDYISTDNIYQVISKHSEMAHTYQGLKERFYVMGFLKMYGKSLRAVRNNRSAKRLEFGNKLTMEDLGIMQSKLEKQIMTLEESLEVVINMQNEVCNT